jgi:Tol biopolymer transport system component
VPGAAFLRVLHLVTGDYILIGPERFKDLFTSRRVENELWFLSKEPGSRPVRIGQRMSEGMAISKKSLKIAYAETSNQNPALPKGASRLSTAELDLTGPKIINQKVVRQSPDDSCTLQPQDFYENDSKLTFTCFHPGNKASVMSMDLKTGQEVNMSQAPDTYNEPYGIFPDGIYTTVLADRHAYKYGAQVGSRQMDIYKLRLDGTGKDFQRLTYFNDYETYKASNSVVSTDGRFMAFQVARGFDEPGVGHGILLYRFP